MPVTIFDGFGPIWSTYVGPITITYKTAPFQTKARRMVHNSSKSVQWFRSMGVPVTIFDGFGPIWSTFVGPIAIKSKTAPFQIKARRMVHNSSKSVQ